MQTIIFNPIFCLLFVGFCAFTIVAQAQFVRLTIQVPIGYEVKVNPIEPIVIEPPIESMSNFSAFAPVKKSIRWIEMRSRENGSFILSYSDEKTSARVRGLFEYFLLNDGTTNFNSAKRITSRYDSHSFYYEEKLRVNMSKELLYFTAWIGIPAERNGLIRIEYL